MPHLERLGRIVDTTGLSREVIRSLADARHSLVLVVKGQSPQLLLLHERMDTDQDYASHAVWVDGVIICNDGSGTVRIVTDSSVTMVEGRRWIAKDLVYEAADDIVQVVPAADGEVVPRLLELSHHRISPSKFGATLLDQLTEQPVTLRRRDEGIDVTTLHLSVLDAGDEPLLLHQARYRDGALLNRPGWPPAGGERDPAADARERAGGGDDQRDAAYLRGASYLRLSRHARVRRVDRWAGHGVQRRPAHRGSEARGVQEDVRDDRRAGGGAAEQGNGRKKARK